MGKYNTLLRSELKISDFDSLSGTQWLTDFVIKCSLEASIRTSNDDRYKFIPVEISFALFNMTENLEKSFYDDVPTYQINDILVLPLHINRNHWCLLMIEFQIQEFLFIDSKGSNSSKIALSF